MGTADLCRGLSWLWSLLSPGTCSAPSRLPSFSSRPSWTGWKLACKCVARATTCWTYWSTERTWITFTWIITSTWSLWRPWPQRYQSMCCCTQEQNLHESRCVASEEREATVPQLLSCWPNGSCFTLLWHFYINSEYFVLFRKEKNHVLGTLSTCAERSCGWLSWWWTATSSTDWEMWMHFR